MLKSICRCISNILFVTITILDQSVSVGLQHKLPVSRVNQDRTWKNL